MIDVFLDGVPPRQRSAVLFDQLRSAILTGRLAAGDRLPTSRELAVELGIARSTIATVYARLVGEGYAEGRIGDGTFVADYHKPTARPATAATLCSRSSHRSAGTARRAAAGATRRRLARRSAHRPP